jgi:hypothetical protein
VAPKDLTSAIGRAQQWITCASACWCMRLQVSRAQLVVCVSTPLQEASADVIEKADHSSYYADLVVRPMSLQTCDLLTSRHPVHIHFTT